MTYDPEAPPGTWEHRSGDCPLHGLNLPFAKPYRTRELYKCCECLKAETLVAALKRSLGGEE